MGIRVAGTNVTLTMKSVTTGSVAGTATASVSVTWPVPFVNTNYIVTADVEINETGDSLRVLRVLSKTTTGCVILVKNDDALTAKTGTLHAMAVAS